MVDAPISLRAWLTGRSGQPHPDRRHRWGLLSPQLAHAVAAARSCLFDRRSSRRSAGGSPTSPRAITALHRAGDSRRADGRLGCRVVASASRAAVLRADAAAVLRAVILVPSDLALGYCRDCRPHYRLRLCDGGSVRTLASRPISATGNTAALFAAKAVRRHYAARHVLWRDRFPAAAIPARA